jgi:mannose-6-phosphate isomerase-like protein (cupin superfamily)
MKKGTFLTLICIVIFVTASNAQQSSSIDTIKPPKVYENTYNRPVYSDSLQSSFVIFIKKEVKLHKHVTHTEQVYVLQGTGEMILGEKKITVKKGDMIFIPKNTPHSLKVISVEPMKVLSIQAPNFDGKDRVMLGPNMDAK